MVEIFWVGIFAVIVPGALMLFFIIFRTVGVAIVIFRKKPTLLTITDVIVDGDLILCAYQLKISVRNHHVPAWDVLSDPCDLISSFVFEYLDRVEQELLMTFSACNQAIKACRVKPERKVMKIGTGHSLTVMIIGDAQSDCQSFTLRNLASLTGLCRRYRSPEEVENLLQTVFSRVSYG